MSVFEHSEFDKHESVHYFDDPRTGLQAIVAIHSTALGPAAGGCRRWQYVNDDDALTDVLRLSRGMTYKNAVAGLPFGGGKSVILAHDDAPKTPELFHAFGRVVDSLSGCYITAEDVGIDVDDIRAVNEETRWVSGLPQSANSAGGDPSPWTAYGVFLGICAAAKSRLGADSMAGIRVAVQGVGNVGRHLCRHLVDAGATVTIADVSRRNVQSLSESLPVTVVSHIDILSADVDILAPCALGNVLNSASIPRIRASVVAGAANNQLSTPRDGLALKQRDILYAPDYVINAGGVISVAREFLGQSSELEVRREVDRIPERLQGIFSDARSEDAPTNVVADRLAVSMVEAAGRQKSVATAAADRRIA